MHIETVPIGSLVFDPANARKHDDKNIQAIRSSLARFKQQKPIVVDADNIVIAGNGTLEAAKSLGWDTITINRTHLKGPEAIAFAIADNRTAELAEWEKETLGSHLQGLREDGWELEELGFNLEDLETLADLPNPSAEGNIDDDEVPEVKDENPFQVERGQIWKLGNHRLMCGDSTAKEDVDRLMDGEKADMVFTDPPYGMAAVENSGVLSKRYKPIEGDEDPDLAKRVFKIFSNIPGIWWGANYYSSVLPDAPKWLVWDKNNGGSDQTDCELAWTNLKGVVRQFTQASEKSNRVHPTQKPVSLIEWAFDLHDGNRVLDLFLGSGSTLIACEKTNRKCYGMEIDPHYCSVIINRWQEFTGKEASLEG